MKLLAAVAALIVYGSLYPFDFAAPTDLASSLGTLFTDFTLWTSRGDVLGNVGLFVPYGLAGVYARPAMPQRAHFAVTLAIGIALALLIQIAQIWAVSRSAVLADVFWNTLGICLGIVAAAVVGSDRMGKSLGLNPHRMATLSLLSLWLLSELAPLVPSIDLVGFRRSVRSLISPPTIDPIEAFYTAAQVVLAGRLMTAAVDPRRAAIALGAAVAAIIAGKILVVGLTLSWTVLVGLLSGLVLWRALSGGARPTATSVVLGVVTSAYVLQALAPFTTRDAAAFHWIPFASVLDGGMLNNLRALASAAFVLGGMIWLLPSRSPAVVTLAVATLALGLEIAQVWIEGRTAGTTEAAAAVIVGWALAHTRSLEHARPT